jgi:hypothetical protein
MIPLDHFILKAREMTARQQVINAGRRFRICKDCLKFRRKSARGRRP